MLARVADIARAARPSAAVRAGRRPATTSRVDVPRAGFDFGKLRIHAAPGEAHAERESDRAMQHSGRAPAAAPDAPLATVAVAGGRPLDDATRATLEPFFARRLDAVRVHDDARAARLARGHVAQAVTYGNHVFFDPARYSEASSAGRRLVAHEVAHVVQQCGQPHAPAPALAAQAVDSAVDVVTAVKEKLAQPDPIAGIGDPSAAFAILTAVTDDQVLLEALEALETEFLLDQLLAIVPNLPQADVDRVTAAMTAVKFAHAQQGAVSKSEIESFVSRVDGMPDDRRQRFVRHVMVAHGIDEGVLTQSLEGAEAMREMNDPSAASAPIAAATQAVQPAPWNPPGAQPIPFYIGNEAHRAIAQEYRVAHPGNLVFTNVIPISSILASWELLGNTVNRNLGASELAAMPDIADLTGRRLYEIKPLAALDLAVAEAKLYQRIFQRAGISMDLGPTTEPGTVGVVPAPAGVYIFESLKPGAITYQYRRAVLEPVPVREPAPARERSTSRWELPDLEFSLRPLTEEEKRALGLGVAAAAGAALLLLLVIVLLPVGA